MSPRMGVALVPLGAAAVVAGAALVVPTATAEPTEASTEFPSDEYGYLDSAARCDDTVVAFGRTSRALVAICVRSDGQLDYRGVRLSDDASLTMPASQGADGAITASNDGVTYTVTPELLLVSDGDNVLYRDAWIEFREPGFSGERPTASSTATTPETTTETTTSPPATTTAPETTTATPTTTSAPETPPPTPTASSSPTVSTTTVTLTPSTGSD